MSQVNYTLETKVAAPKKVTVSPKLIKQINDRVAKGSVDEPVYTASAQISTDQDVAYVLLTHLIKHKRKM